MKRSLITPLRCLGALSLFMMALLYFVFVHREDASGASVDLIGRETKPLDPAGGLQESDPEGPLVASTSREAKRVQALGQAAEVDVAAPEVANSAPSGTTLLAELQRICAASSKKDSPLGTALGPLRELAETIGASSQTLESLLAELEAQAESDPAESVPSVEDAALILAGIATDGELPEQWVEFATRRSLIPSLLVAERIAREAEYDLWPTRRMRFWSGLRIWPAGLKASDSRDAPAPIALLAMHREFPSGPHAAANWQTLEATLLAVLGPRAASSYGDWSELFPYIKEVETNLAAAWALTLAAGADMAKNSELAAVLPEIERQPAPFTVVAEHLLRVGGFEDAVASAITSTFAPGVKSNLTQQIHSMELCAKLAKDGKGPAAALASATLREIALRPDLEFHVQRIALEKLADLSVIEFMAAAEIILARPGEARLKEDAVLNLYGVPNDHQPAAIATLEKSYSDTSTVEQKWSVKSEPLTGQELVT